MASLINQVTHQLKHAFPAGVLLTSLTLPALAAAEGPLPNHSQLPETEIKVGFRPGGLNEYTYYTREELIGRGTNFSIAPGVVNLQTFYEFQVPHRDTTFEINACETVSEALNNNAPLVLTNPTFQIGRGKYPNVFWTDVPRTPEEEFSRFLPNGCELGLDFQYLRDYQAGFSTPGKTEPGLDHFEDIHVRTRFDFAGLRTYSPFTPVTAYSPAINLNLPAQGALGLHAARGRNFADASIELAMDTTNIYDQNGSEAAHHSYAWLLGYRDATNRRYYFNHVPATEIIDYNFVDNPGYVFGAPRVTLAQFLNYQQYRFPAGARPFIEGVVYYADQGHFERTPVRATLFHEDTPGTLSLRVRPAPEQPWQDVAVCAQNPRRCFQHDRAAELQLAVADPNNLISISVRVEALAAAALNPQLLTAAHQTLKASSAQLALTVGINDANFHAQNKDRFRLVVAAHDQFGGVLRQTITLNPYRHLRGDLAMYYQARQLPGAENEFFNINVDAAGAGYLTVDYAAVRAEDLAEYTITGRQWFDGTEVIPGATTNIYYLDPASARARAAQTPLRFVATYKNTGGYLYDLEARLTLPQLAVQASEPSYAFDGSTTEREPGTLTAQWQRPLPADWTLNTLEIINNADGQRPQVLRQIAPATLPSSWIFSINDFSDIYNPDYGGEKFPRGADGWRTPPYYSVFGQLRQKNGVVVKIASPPQYHEDTIFTPTLSLVIVDTAGQAAPARPDTLVSIVRPGQTDYNGAYTLGVQWFAAATPTPPRWTLLRAPSTERERPTRPVRPSELAGKYNYMRAVVNVLDRFAGVQTVTIAPVRVNAPTTGQLSISIVNNLMTADGYVTLITSAVQDDNGGEFIAYNWYFIKPITDEIGIQQIQTPRKQISQLEIALLNMGLQLNVEAVFRDSLGFVTTLTAQADYQQMARQGDDPTHGTFTLAGPTSWYPGAVFTAETAGLTDANGLGTLTYHWWADLAPGRSVALPGSTQAQYTLQAADWAEASAAAAPRLRVSIVHTDQAFYEQVFEATRTHQDRPPPPITLARRRVDRRQHH